MIDYKNLAETLRFCATDGECKSCPGGAANCAGVFGFFNALLTKAADAIEELLADAPKWISVKDKLPEKRKWVLCWCVSNTQEVLRWENNEWYHDPMHVYFSDFVTHWMPLPEPPEEEME